MSDILELGRAILSQQGLSAYLGAELVSLEEGRAEIVLRLNEHLLQQHGFAHGGTVSYLVDTAISFAGGSVLGPDVLMQEYKISLCRPGVGESLVARATVVYRSRRQAVCRCDVYAIEGAQETLCATALGTVVSAEGSR